MNAQPSSAVSTPGPLASLALRAVAMDKNIDSLTGLRFYAAFAVFLSHMYHVDYFGIEAPFRLLLSSVGHLGVSLFYVLSGFVLLIRYQEALGGKARLKTFYVARLARIYPAFIATGLLAIPIEWFSPFRGQMAWTLASNATLTHCLAPQTCGRLNDVGWSVGVEAAFYLLFPLLLAAMCHRLALLATMGLLATGIFALHSLFPGSFWASDRFFINRTPEFLCGMLVGSLYLRGVSLPGVASRRGLIGWVTGLALVLILTPLALERVHLDAYYPFVLMLPCALLIAALARAEQRGITLGVLTLGWVVFGGEISYSFYLIHNLLLRYVRHGALLIGHVSLETLPLAAQLGLAVLALLAALGASALLYRHIEKPWRHKLRQWLR